MRRTALALVLLILLPSLLALLALTPPAAGEGNIVIATDDNVVWEGGSRNLTGKVEIYGTLNVRDCELHFNITRDGEASFWVMQGGLLRFDNVSLLRDNLSANFLMKVEGRFIAHDSHIEHLTGQFIEGGGIKCVNGEVELYNTNVTACQVQAVYVEGTKGKALLEGCLVENLQYGVHVTGGGSVTVRGTVFERFTRAGVLINKGEGHISNSTFLGVRSSLSQGIAARDAQLQVSDCEIHEIHSEAIEMTDETWGSVTNCQIWNATVGIRMTSSSADVWSCNIRDCLDALNLLDSDPNIKSCRLTGNVNGVSSKDCSPAYELRDCIIGDNEQYGAYVVGKGFSEEGTVWEVNGRPNSIARVIQWWTLDIQVNDTADIAVAGANVVVRFSNDTRAFNGSTNALGAIRDIILEGHRVTNDGTNFTQKAYTVTITKGEREAQKKLNVNMDKSLTVFLGQGPEDATGSPWFWVVISIIVVVALAGVGLWWYRYYR